MTVQPQPVGLAYTGLALWGWMLTVTQTLALILMKDRSLRMLARAKPGSDIATTRPVGHVGRRIGPGVSV